MMRLEDYRAQNQGLSYDEFRRLPLSKAIGYDFLRQGGEPDETHLSHLIYEKLYPWFRPQLHRGDTMNTYRVSVRQNYRYYYATLDEETRKEIVGIVKRYTRRNRVFLFEFEKDNGHYQLCNNYQVGNFMVFPRGKINRARVSAPVLDYFDRLLYLIKAYYDKTLIPDNATSLEITMSQDYFDMFAGFEDYVEQNYLQDFFDEKGEIIPLGDLSDFESYVMQANQIIHKRSERIVRQLKALK